MKNLRRRVVPLLALLVLLCGVMTVNAFAADDPTEEIGTKMIECPDCGAVGVVLTDEGTAAACDSCGGTGYVESSSRFFNTFWSLLPPIIAIALALITKEVYSSLAIGVFTGMVLWWAACCTPTLPLRPRCFMCSMTELLPLSRTAITWVS